MTDQQPNLPPQPPQPFPIGPMPPASAPKRRKVWPWIVGSISAVVILCCGIGVAAGIGADTDARPAAVATTQATSPKPTTAAPTTAAPTTAAPTTPAAAAPPKPAPKPTYKTLSDRDWKLIAKDPDSYIGKTYVVYGSVTQFDAATGDDTFRADVGHKNMAYSYEYDTNTMLNGTPARLKNVVQDDEFRANVTVMGSFSYDTQIGGSTTVPLLRVDAIKIL